MPDLNHIKNTVIDLFDTAKGMPEDIKIHGELLKDNARIIEHMYKEAKNQNIREAVGDEIAGFKAQVRDYKNLTLNYNTAKTLVQKYPDIREYLNANADEGYSSDMVNLPVIAVLTTLSGSVISVSKNLFERIRLQNDVLKRLSDLEASAGTMESDQVILAINEIKKSAVASRKLDIKVVIGVALGCFSGYWFINKTELGRELKKSFMRTMGALR